ncbi:LuxR C-terminal-related transcriptional regulator [Streptomyces antibioticus]|uniref:LuxR C-terminal-related transcriptional regulator n=1 Tax=Streptomyces antibioticus TaxID=1890 RepID=UPI0036AFEFC9
MARIGTGKQPLVGRIAELALFREALKDPGCRGVTISGPRGVGKSRLADECLKAGAAAGWQVLRVTATRGASAVPFGAIAHLIPAGITASDIATVFAGIASGLGGKKTTGAILLVEDLPLLDQSSIIIIQRLSDAGKVFLLTTMRDGERENPDSDALIKGYGFRQVGLRNLDQELTHRLLEALLEGAVSRRTAYEMYLRSAGNPLFLRELVIAALDSQTMRSDGEIWDIIAEPEGTDSTPQLDDLIEFRLSAVSDASRAFLETISVCGDVVLDGVVAAAEQNAALLELESEGLVHISLDRRRTRVDLAHPIYGEVLQRKMPAFRRRHLFLRQAEALEARGLRRRDDFFRSVAWRVEATGSARTEDLISAARLAMDRHSYARAVHLLEAVPKTEVDTPCLLLLSQCLAQAGRTEAIEPVLASAQELAADEDQIFDVAFARAQYFFWVQGRQEEALTVIAEAGRDTHGPSASFRLRSAEGTIRIACGDPQTGLDVLGVIDHEAEGPRDINALLLGLMYQSPGLTMTGRTTEAVQIAESAYATHLKHYEQVLYLHPSAQRIGLIFAFAESGRLSEARATGDLALRELMAARAQVPHLWAALQLARTEWLAGHPRSARHWYAECVALARSHGQTLAMRPALCGLAAAAAQVHDIAAARKASAEAEQFPHVGMFVGEDAMAAAWLHAAAGELATARELLTRAAGKARAAGVVSSEAALLTDVARMGGARQVTKQLSTLAEGSDSPFNQARAVFAAALAANEPQSLEEVSVSFEEMGADLLSAEAAAAAASGWKRIGEARRSTAAANRTSQLTERCEGAITPPLATALEPAAALTARERDIAALISSGASAQDAAESLSISRRTVENHLYNIYGKLGVSSRAELKKKLESPLQ